MKGIIISLESVNNIMNRAASQNKGALKVFQLNDSCKTIPLNPLDISAIIVYKDGKRQKREFGYGSSFLSQSARFLNIDEYIISVEIKNNKGEIRRIDMDHTN